jgi:Spy/CpxP family protein refolding chaperone
MMMQKASLTAILAAGAMLITPALRAAETNTPAAPTPPGERGPGGRQQMSADEQVARLSEQLSLTEEQKPKVKAVLEDVNKKRAELRGLPQEERGPKVQALREETTKKMKEILTEEQFKKYEALPRGRGPGGQGGPGAPGGPRPGGENTPPPAKP